MKIAPAETQVQPQAQASPGPGAQAAVLRPRCLSIDLEVGRDDARIHQFAAVRGDSGAGFT